MLFISTHTSGVIYSAACFSKNVSWRQKMIPYCMHIGWPSYLAFYYLTFILHYQNHEARVFISKYTGLLHQSFNGADIRHADSRWSINDYGVSENRLNFAMLLTLTKRRGVCVSMLHLTRSQPFIRKSSPFRYRSGDSHDSWPIILISLPPRHIACQSLGWVS